jgi:protein ImuB
VRIACTYLPSFPLQVHVRRAPHLAGEAFAVTSAGAGVVGPRVIVCSRAAWNRGVRPGMSPSEARAACPELRVVPAEPALYRSALEALADGLLSLSDTVDIGPASEQAPPHQALYLEVPPASRGASFGQKLLVQLSRQGFRGRIGIADDRFTAWAAATTLRGRNRPSVAGTGSPLFAQACTTVPRGGSAAFLAPLSVSLLPLGSDVADLLDTLGVHTLGAFAALPPPSVARPGDPTRDFQNLARGDGPDGLRPYRPTAPAVEAVELPRPVTDREPLSFVLRPLGDRLCERLRGRGRAAAAVTLRLFGPEAGELTEVAVTPSRPATTAVSLVEAARKRLAAVALPHPVTTVELAVTREVEPDDDEVDLLGGLPGLGGVPGIGAVDDAIARLESSLEPRGSRDRDARSELSDAEAIRSGPLWGAAHNHRRTRRGKQRRRRPAGTGEQRVAVAAAAGVRLLDPPALQPTGLRTIEVGGSSLRVVASHAGAAPASADRDYYEVETDDGGRYWVFRRQSDGRYYLHGIFD